MVEEFSLLGKHLDHTWPAVFGVLGGVIVHELELACVGEHVEQGGGRQ